MTNLIARTGRLQQRYQDGCRLVAGCIPFRYRDSDGDKSENIEVLMINSTSGPGLLFPKGGWEDDETVEEAALREAMEEAGVHGELLGFLGFYCFNSKTNQDGFCPEGRCKAAMFALHVKEQLSSWPEQSTRERHWITIDEARERCRYAWMLDALVCGFLKWHDDHLAADAQNDPTSGHSDSG